MIWILRHKFIIEFYSRKKRRQDQNKMKFDGKGQLVSWLVIKQFAFHSAKNGLVDATFF